MSATLDEALGPGEVATWRGTVFATRDRRSMLVTDRRIVLTDPEAPAGWVGIDVAEIAEHGVMLPRSRWLTLAANTPDGPVRFELRPVDPPTFDGIEWPAAARPLIEQQLAASEAARVELRTTLRRVVAGTIAGLVLLLALLALVLALT